MDRISFKDSQLELVRVLEEFWMEDVKNIWSSICYGNLMDLQKPIIPNTTKSKEDDPTCPINKNESSRPIRATVPDDHDFSNKGLRFTLPGYR